MHKDTLYNYALNFLKIVGQCILGNTAFNQERQLGGYDASNRYKNPDTKTQAR